MQGILLCLNQPKTFWVKKNDIYGNFSMAQMDMLVIAWVKLRFLSFSVWMYIIIVSNIFCLFVSVYLLDSEEENTIKWYLAKFTNWRKNPQDFISLKEEGKKPWNWCCLRKPCILCPPISVQFCSLFLMFLNLNVEIQTLCKKINYNYFEEKAFLCK